MHRHHPLELICTPAVDRDEQMDMHKRNECHTIKSYSQPPNTAKPQLAALVRGVQVMDTCWLIPVVKTATRTCTALDSGAYWRSLDRCCREETIEKREKREGDHREKRECLSP